MLMQYSRVKLKTDKFQSEGISLGDIGYIIEDYEDGNYEVEFSNPEGITIAQIVVSLKDLESAE